MLGPKPQKPQQCLRIHTIYSEPLPAFCSPWFVIAGCTVLEEELMAVLMGKSESSDLNQTEHTRQSGLSFSPCQGGQMFMCCWTKGTRSLKASYSVLPGNWDSLLACPVSVDPAET